MQTPSIVTILLLLCRLVQARGASADAAEQAAASAGLGLAVLAGFCRVPALAECQGVIEKAPLLLRVTLPSLSIASPLFTPARFPCM